MSIERGEELRICPEKLRVARMIGFARGMASPDAASATLSGGEPDIYCTAGCSKEKAWEQRRVFGINLGYREICPAKLSASDGSDMHSMSMDGQRQS